MTDTIESLRAELAGCQKENAKLVARKQREGERGYLWAEWKRRAEDVDMQLRGVKAELAEATEYKDRSKRERRRLSDERDRAQARATRLEDAVQAVADATWFNGTEYMIANGKDAEYDSAMQLLYAALTDTTEEE